MFAIAALFAYSISLALIIPTLLLRKERAWRRFAILFAVIALIFHIMTLQQRFQAQGGMQNLSLLNIISLVSLLICAIMTIVASRNHGWLLLPFVYGFALVNLIFGTFVPDVFITHPRTTPAMMVHIGLALFAYSVLIIAALYALQLAWIDHRLKSRKLAFNNDIPPLMSIERKMFHITQIGMLLFTMVLFSGWFYPGDLFNRENINKVVLTLSAWLVYSILLWGHRYRSWRGLRVVWFNCCGALLLTVAYFGSRVLQHFLTSS